MSRTKETKTYTLQELREFADGLRIVAARVDAAIEIAKTADHETVDVANWKSGDMALQKWLTFSKSLHQAIDELVIRPSKNG